MKQKILTVAVILVFSAVSFAQRSETFDIVTYTAPAGWQKQAHTKAVIFAAEDKSKNAFCAITLFKAVPAAGDSKKNFAIVWETFVKESLGISAAPAMQPAAADENGWTAQSGFAPYQSDGTKGLAMLIALTGGGKVVPVLILTNSEFYQTEVSQFLAGIVLPKVVAEQNLNDKQKAQPQVARKSKFRFVTTNFGDGWTAAEEENWVQVTKGSIAVLVHYPNHQTDAYNSVLRNGLLNAWNNLVAPRYSNLRNFELRPIQSFESISFAEADATENSTGRNVHVVLFKKHYSKGNGRYLEFIASSKADFEREFGAYRNDEFGWDKLANMQGYNKFAVAASDLVGKWASSDFASLSYYYTNGGFAGATATSLSDSFFFINASSYQSDHAGASGIVGNQKWSRQIYNGKYTVDKWKLTLTNRFKGGSEIYDCSFEAIKGGRILKMTDSRGGYTLVKQ